MPLGIEHHKTTHCTDFWATCGEVVCREHSESGGEIACEDNHILAGEHQQDVVCIRIGDEYHDSTNWVD